MDIISSLLMCNELTTLPSRARDALVNLGEILRAAQIMNEGSANPADIIDFILSKTGYTGSEKLLESEQIDRNENLSVMISEAKTYADLASYLEDAALLSSSDTSAEDDQITLMTLHAAKGLEFPVVFLAGMEEGLFPHSRVYSSGPEELEEERRLCYVGMTRAKQELILSFAASRAQFGQRSYNAPSRFITDAELELEQFNEDFSISGATDEPFIDEYVDNFYNDEPQIQVGDRVRSAAFGDGEIIDIEGMAVEVKFDRGGSKKLNAEFARLEKI